MQSKPNKLSFGTQKIGHPQPIRNKRLHQVVQTTYQHGHQHLHSQTRKTTYKKGDKIANAFKDQCSFKNQGNTQNPWNCTYEHPSQIHPSQSLIFQLNTTIKHLTEQNNELDARIKQYKIDNIGLVAANQKLKQMIEKLIAELGQILHHKKSESEQPIKQRVYSEALAQDQRKIIEELVTLNHSLQCQNKLLYNLKHNLQLKIQQMQRQISQLKEHNQSLYNDYCSCKEQSASKQKNNAGLLQQIANLSRTIQEKHNSIIKLQRQKQQEQKQSQQIHQKFHLEVERLKERAEKYKLRSEQHRKERDQLAMEMQKAKLEIGGITLRQYFPDLHANRY